MLYAFLLISGQAAAVSAAPQAAPTGATAWIPSLPPEPVLSASDYPNCRSNLSSATDRSTKYDLIRQCYEAIGRYQQFMLPAFETSVRDYLKAVDAIGYAFDQTRPSKALRDLMDAEVSAAHTKFQVSATSQLSGAGAALYDSEIKRASDDLEDLHSDMDCMQHGRC